MMQRLIRVLGQPALIVCKGAKALGALRIIGHATQRATAVEVSGRPNPCRDFFGPPAHDRRKV